jgi:hypothetical protein
MILQNVLQKVTSDPEEIRELVATWSINLGYSAICRQALTASLSSGTLSSSLVDTIAKLVNQKAFANSTYSSEWKNWYVQ